MKLVRIILSAQGFYTLLTALWPLVHIESFMFVTGPKTDIWLVKTVGALLIPIALTLVYYLYNSSDLRPAIILGSTTAVAFIAVDFYYALNDVISDIYLLDGAVEVLFLICWIYIFISKRS
jgi:hypothetical protein